MSTITTAGALRAAGTTYVPPSLADEDKIEINDQGFGHRVGGYHPPSRVAVELAALDAEGIAAVGHSVLGFLVGLVSKREHIGSSQRELLMAELAEDAIRTGLAIHETRQQQGKEAA